MNKSGGVPSVEKYDGVDYVPMPLWKTLLIQFLNIAGLGPIFGAILGATYGPVAFIWITLGGIFIGAMHDYCSGAMSVKLGGATYPEIIGHYLGRNARRATMVVTVALMVVVGAVFLAGPAMLLQSMTSVGQNFWVVVILLYYVLATLLPIDKIIGRIYPVFGAALILMALLVFGALLFEDSSIPELTFASMTNMKADAAKFPIFPMLFITIACGAISGFHATQSPLMARCVKRGTDARPTFFGSMIAESIVALIWAAIAMTFFGGVGELNTTLAEHKGSAPWVIDMISTTLLGKIGAILVVVGVIAAPITTGDTAFRTARMIIADFAKVSQRKFVKRLIISIPIFIVGFGITLLDFDTIWRYFSWVNQTLAVITLWTIGVYLSTQVRQAFIAIIPAIFMTFIVVLYIFVSPDFMICIDQRVGMILAGGVAILVAAAYFRYVNRIKQEKIDIL